MRQNRSDIEGIDMAVYVYQKAITIEELTYRILGYIVTVYNTTGSKEITFDPNGNVVDSLDLKKSICEELDIVNLFEDMPIRESISLYQNGVTIVPLALRRESLPEKAADYIKKHYKWRG